MLNWGAAWTVHYATRDAAEPEDVRAWLRGAVDGVRAFLDEAAIPDGLPFLLSPRFEYDVALAQSHLSIFPKGINPNFKSNA